MAAGGRREARLSTVRGPVAPGAPGGAEGGTAPHGGKNGEAGAPGTWEELPHSASPRSGPQEARAGPQRTLLVLGVDGTLRGLSPGSRGPGRNPVHP